MKYLLLLTALLSAVGSSYARTVSIADNPLQDRQPAFYDKNAEGWYWYHDPERIDEIKEISKPVAPQETKSGPAPLSAAWVREMLPKYKDMAWTDPSPENVEAYFLLQRFAVDRSQKFAQVAQSVVIGNPYLDEVNRRPVASFAIPSVDRQARLELDDLLKKISTKAGLFFFFKSGCPYCESQAPILKYLESDGFDILAISIDGGALQSAQFENTRLDSGQAQKLGVTATPSLFLVSDKGEFTSLGQGMMSYAELQSRILIVAAREGWITEEEINKTRPIMNGDDPKHNMSENLPRMLQASSQKAMGLPTEEESRRFDRVAKMTNDHINPLVQQDGFIEPKNLLKLLNDDTRLSGKMNANE